MALARRCALRLFGAAILSFGIYGGTAAVPAFAQPGGVVVFAAASLKNALDEVASGWEAETGKKVTVSFAASSALAKQIEAGAPADIFISADLDWMDDVQGKNLIKPATRANLLGNEIVLIAPADSTAAVTVAPGMDLVGALAGGKLAMADTGAVPAGKYGKAALEALGVWASIEGSVAQAENARAALALVSRGEAPLGIVYRTDAAADPNVKVLGAFPEETHPPIVYPIAVVAASDNPDAEALVAHLQTREAKTVFEKHGFKALD